jgi:sporulation-control protein spo0M
MIQIVKYKCCNKIFAACVEPECYIDKQWLNNLKEYVNRGDIVQMVENIDLQFEKCYCKDKSKMEQLNLFNIA